MNCLSCGIPSKSAADDEQGRCLACVNYDAQVAARQTELTPEERYG